ncbi:MAG: 23S rRNA (pseudouridine(1915)-N(3))-methyltransferase RlmH, partial [Wenzhouxiangellaceae bacterium]
WIAAGWKEYSRRLPRHMRLRLIEVPPARGSGVKARDLEGQTLLARCPDNAVRVALDESGSSWSTAELARRMSRWLEHGRPVALLIGGAEGHGAGLRSACDACWSLSRLTFPHMLVRVVLAEQIYRAWSLLSGHPYHRE